MRKNLFFILIIIFGLIIAAYGYFIEPRMLEINRYVVQDSGLKGVKIVFASDFHIKPYGKKRLDKIVNLINAENPDLVLSAGDYVCGHPKHSTMPIDKIAQKLGNIKSKYGFYTTLGNHDGWYGAETIASALEKNNIKVLSNKNVRIDINGQKFYIAGVEDLMTGEPRIYKALEGIDEHKDFVIMLSHTPDMFPKIPNDIKLTLAGHTHGGQVRIPFLGSIFTASNYGDKYALGWIREVDNKTVKPEKSKPISLAHKTLFTTKGLGVSIFPFRFNCVPEIDVIEFE